MVQGRLRSTAVKLLITGGVLAGAVYVADRFNLGSRVAGGARSLGEVTGETITRPFAGIVGGVASGLEDLRAQVDRILNPFGNQESGVVIDTGSITDTSDAGNDEPGFAARLLQTFRPEAQQEILGQIDQSENLESFKDRISNIVNPQAETTGFFEVEYANGVRAGPFPFSQATVDFYKNLGARIIPV